MVGHAVVREDATKDITVVSVVPNTIFTSFDVLWDLPRNGHLTGTENHRRPLPLEPVRMIQQPNGGRNIVIIRLSDGQSLILLADRYSYPPPLSFFAPIFPAIIDLWGTSYVFFSFCYTKCFKIVRYFLWIIYDIIVLLYS